MDEEYNYTEYKVVRKYYINGEKVAEVTGGWKVGIIGENISANELSEENPNWKFSCHVGNFSSVIPGLFPLNSICIDGYPLYSV